MSSSGSSGSFRFQSVEGEYRAQQQSSNREINDKEDGRPKPEITSQGTAFQSTPEENSVGQGNLVYSRMKNQVVMNVPKKIRLNETQSVNSYTKNSYSQPLPRNMSQNVDSGNSPTRLRKDSPDNFEKTPERPQDLINKISFGVAKVNVKSSAQYRKSYAFKIWREKGCFPFRLEDQPTSEEQKKSKKYLNAIKAQRDRQNEEAWRAYKSSKAKKPATPQLSEDVVEVRNENVKEYEQTAFTASQGQGVTKRNTVQYNNIPYYFKSKKETTSQKRHVTPVTKAIPTSVIHVNNTKRCENYEAISQARQRTTKAVTELHDQQSDKNDTRSVTMQTITTVAGDSQVRLITNEESTRIHTNNFTQWPCETSPGVSVNRRQRLQIEGYTSAENLGHKIASAATSVDNQDNGMRSGSKSQAEVQQLVPGSAQHAAYSSGEIPENQLDSTDTSDQVNHQHDKSDNVDVKDNDDRDLSCQKKIESQVSDALQRSAPDGVHERRDDHHSPSNSSTMVAIMKSTLNKKYCKENMKPKPGNRKRMRSNQNAVSEVGDGQRGRAKQSKATVFTRLDETVATNLADGIHNVNSEYFPIDTLANKAAQETSEKMSTIKSEPAKLSIKKKVEEINRARLLLKELFDVTTESAGDNEMKTFDVASRTFGRKNILNHLSLLDRYFAEFQNKLSTKAATPSMDPQLI